MHFKWNDFPSVADFDESFFEREVPMSFGPHICRARLHHRKAQVMQCNCPRRNGCKALIQELNSLLQHNYEMFLVRRADTMNSTVTFVEKLRLEGIRQRISEYNSRLRNMEEVEQTVNNLLNPRDADRVNNNANNPAVPPQININESNDNRTEATTEATLDGEIQGVDDVNNDTSMVVVELKHVFDPDLVETTNPHHDINRSFIYHGFSEPSEVEVVMRTNEKKEKVSFATSEKSTSSSALGKGALRAGGLTNGAKKQLGRALKKLVEVGKIKFYLANNHVQIKCTTRNQNLTGVVMLTLRDWDKFEDHRRFIAESDNKVIEGFSFEEIDYIYKWRIALFNAQFDIFVDTEMMVEIANRNGVDEDHAYAALPFLPAIDESTLEAYARNLRNPELENGERSNAKRARFNRDNSQK